MSNLPKWIEHGAFVLAFIAGTINAIGLLGFEHSSISHVSGIATLFGSHILEGSLSHSIHLLGIICAFFIGASISGFLLHGSSVKLGRHYDTALLVESFLIFMAFYFLSQGNFYGHFAASAACGVQNALASNYSGAVIRTTHLTGIVTDLGLMLGSVLRGESFEQRKAVLFLLIILGFILGGTFGAYLFSFYQFHALLVPAGMCLTLAVIYRVKTTEIR